MPTTWNQVKVNVPGYGERAYIVSYWGDNSSSPGCQLNPNNVSLQCAYISNTEWGPGRILENEYLNLNQWYTWKFYDLAGVYVHGCLQVNEMVDETTFNNGTCTSCPTSSLCNNCLYNSLTGAGNVAPTIQLAYPGYALTYTQADFTAGTSSNCSDCVQQIQSPAPGNPTSWQCCDPHSLLFSGRNSEVFPPTNIGGGWLVPNNNVIPLLPWDIMLNNCAFRGLNEPVSNGNLIINPINLWDDPQGWNQSITTPSNFNLVDVHSFTQLLSQTYPYYDKISNQPIANFLDGIIILPISGHTSLSSISGGNQNGPGGTLNTTMIYQEDYRGTGCQCSGQTSAIQYDCDCITQHPNNYIDPSLYGTSSVQPVPNTYMQYISDTYGPTANFNQYWTSAPCNPNAWGNNGQYTHCPNPYDPGMCITRKTAVRIGSFGDPSNAIYGPLIVYGAGGWSSPTWFSNYQAIVDWLNLVASTEGWVGGFTTSMSKWQLIDLAESQNTYNNQDYYNAMISSGNASLAGIYQTQNGQLTPHFQRVSIGQAGSLCKQTQTSIPTLDTTDVMLLGGLELKEKYVTSPVSGFGTRMTNTLASGSWDNIRNFLYGAGMPNSITDYENARPWFESNANSAAMGLQTSVNPLAYPDNAANRVSIFNDVYVVNKSLTSRCPLNGGGNVGCTDATATNYDITATENCDGSILGTTNSGWNSCCTYIGVGCGGVMCWDCDPITYTCYVSSTGPYSSQQQCATACTDCSCIKVIGTGHTGAYHYTNQTQCDDDCCNGPSIKVCDVLIVGDDEGVLHYDVTTNIATHLFSDNSYDKYDIAVTVNKLWVYTQCFVAGTMVETPDGKMAIEKIKTGDIVNTFNTETNKVETSTVTETFIHPNNSNRLIINGKINTTLEHPFYINGVWVDAGDLKVDDELLHVDGPKHKITSIETDTSNQTVYNFEVEGTHTYFVEGYLVHNKQNQTDIKEFDITLSPFTLSFNRLITVPNALIGKGLTWYAPNKLLCANTKVQIVDITPNMNNTASLSTIFSLPTGYKCTGDLLYKPTGNSLGGLFIVVYDDSNTHKVGKFTTQGGLLEESIIPTTIITGTTYFDSLFVDANTNIIYGITNDARVYVLEQSPILQFSPMPVHNAPIPLTLNTSKQIYGADNVQAGASGEMTCARGITIPVTYNCQINLQLNIAGCTDPGNGSGTYTGPQALFNCQNQAPGAGGCITSWNCQPQALNNCENVIKQLPYPTVNHWTGAITYIADPANGLQTMTMEQISYEQMNFPQPMQCLGPTGVWQWRIDYFTCTLVSSQNMYVWSYFIQQCLNAGISVSLNNTYYDVETIIKNHFNITSNNSLFKIYRMPCICDLQPCYCYPVLGSGGQYSTESQCTPICCPPDPCKKCCTNKFGQAIGLSPNTFPCKCPQTYPVEVPCGGCFPNVSCAFGYSWSYTACRCVCDQQQICPWGWYWSDVQCQCITNIQAKQIPSKDYFDVNGPDYTLARGDLNIRLSAITSTNTLFDNTGRPDNSGPGPGPGGPPPPPPPPGSSNGSGPRWKKTKSGACAKCPTNQTEEYYKNNGCSYTKSNCDDKTLIRYYVCNTVNNPVVNESQKACKSTTTIPSGTYFLDLETCLNSGCGGYMSCEQGQSVNGVKFGAEYREYSPIPMCCSSFIKTQQSDGGKYKYVESGPLTVRRCLEFCKDKEETWFPLFNAFGVNTYMDSPLAYLTRELLLQVNIGQCVVSKTNDKYQGEGIIRKNPY